MTDTPDAVKVLDRLIAAAKILYANAERRALNHHGADFDLHGMPGWLADCAADIAAAEALGARAMQAAMAAPAGECGCVHGVTRTPAGAGDLVERAKATATSAAEAGDFEQVTRTIVLLRDLASRIEALEAEVDGWRKATWEAREGIVQRDERLPLLMNGWTARATSAEAERDALKAEVERKDKALREAGEAIAEYFRYLHGGETRGSYDGKPEREGLRKAGYAVSRALAPAKAGG